MLFALLSPKSLTPLVKLLDKIKLCALNNLSQAGVIPMFLVLGYFVRMLGLSLVILLALVMEPRFHHRPDAGLKTHYGYGVPWSLTCVDMTAGEKKKKEWPTRNTWRKFMY